MKGPMASVYSFNEPGVIPPQPLGQPAPRSPAKDARETLIPKQCCDEVHTDASFATPRGSDGEVCLPIPLKGVDPSSWERVAAGARAEATEQDCHPRQHEKAYLNTNIRSCCSKKMGSRVHSTASFHSSIEGQMAHTSPRRPVLSASKSAFSVTFADPSLIQPSRLAERSTSPRCSDNRVKDQEEAAMAVKCIHPQPPKLSCSSGEVRRDGKITLNEPDSCGAVCNSPPTAHRRGLHHLILCKEALRRTRLVFPSESSCGLTAPAPDLCGNLARSPNPPNMHERRMRLPAKHLFTTSQKGPRVGEAVVLDAREPNRLLSEVAKLSPAANQALSLSGDATHEYQIDSPVSNRSENLYFSTHHATHSVGNQETSRGRPESDSCREGVVNWEQEVVKKGNTELQQDGGNPGEPKGSFFHSTIVKPNLPFNFVSQSKGKGGSEEERLRLLQKYHHDIEVIKNGGREVVNNSMKSSASLTKSLSHFRRWCSSFQGFPSTSVSLSPSISASFSVTDSDMGECSKGHQGDESLKDNTRKNRTEAWALGKSPASHMRSPENTKLLYPMMREKNSFIAFDIKQNPRSASCSSTSSSTSSDKAISYLKCGVSPITKSAGIMPK
ncbi:unnamed protein product [Phytomonas sp. EM1]|nr:unnamed protein product [Phytomonas sp. EM1]|eukprot:CCW60500.1 unnamed protein product [Phytomonas sp. isolate EM1]